MAYASSKTPELPWSLDGDLPLHYVRFRVKREIPLKSQESAKLTEISFARSHALPHRCALSPHPNRVDQAYYSIENMVRGGAHVRKRFELWRGRFKYMCTEQARRVSVMQAKLAAGGLEGLVVPRRSLAEAKTDSPSTVNEDAMTQVTAGTEETDEDESGGGVEGAAEKSLAFGGHVSFKTRSRVEPV